jgi:hypothetical protein
MCARGYLPEPFRKCEFQPVLGKAPAHHCGISRKALDSRQLARGSLASPVQVSRSRPASLAATTNICKQAALRAICAQQQSPEANPWKARGRIRDFSPNAGRSKCVRNVGAPIFLTPQETPPKICAISATTRNSSPPATARIERRPPGVPEAHSADAFIGTVEIP